MNMQRMKNAAKNWDAILKFGGGFFGVFTWVVAIVGVMVLIFGERMMDMGTLSLDLEYVTLYLMEGTAVDLHVMKIGMGAGLLVGAAVCFLVSRGAKLLRGILATMKEGRPFEADASARLRKIAWLTLAGGFLMEVIELLDCIVMTRAFALREIFGSVSVTGVEYSYTMDYSFVWFFCGIWMLSYVFEYGQKLQLESDETL